MRKKLVAIAAAATLTVGVNAAAPANAQTEPAVASSEASSEVFNQYGMFILAPAVLLSALPSFLGFEMCWLFDTRGCGNVPT